MNLRDITPYLTAFGPIAGLIVACDYLIKEDLKAKVFDRVTQAAQLGLRPISFGFYGLVTFASVFMTLAIISANGLLAFLSGDSGSSVVGLKSSGPILVAIFLKIVAFDYLLAIKTYLVVAMLRSGRDRVRDTPESQWPVIVSGWVLVFCDLFLTAMLTGIFLNWWEVFQALRITPTTDTGIAKPLTEFFDSMNFIVKESVEKAFYALNGSTVAYLALLISGIAKGALKYVDADSARKNVFKIIAALLAGFVLVVAVSREMAKGKL